MDRAGATTAATDRKRPVLLNLESFQESCDQALVPTGRPLRTVV